MNRLLLASLSIAGLLSAAMTPQLQARTVNCVPDSGCPTGEKPPACCVPPPCEITQALKFAQAEVNSIETNMALFPPSWEGPTHQDMWASKNVEDYWKLMDQASPCPENRFFEPPPLLTVSADNQCEITYFADLADKPDSASLEDMHDGSNSCQELVDAEYKQAEQRRQNCLADNARTDKRSLQERMMQDLAAAKAKRDELLRQLEGYWSVCSVAPDSEDARQAVDDDLVALDPAADKPKPKKKKAKRSGKKLRRK
jgi:hypothetical protein